MSEIEIVFPNERKKYRVRRAWEEVHAESYLVYAESREDAKNKVNIVCSSEGTSHLREIKEIEKSVTKLTEGKTFVRLGEFSEIIDTVRINEKGIVIEDD